MPIRDLLLEFADPPPNPSPDFKDRNDFKNESTLPAEDEPIIPSDSSPKTLMQWAVLILNTPDPTLKVR